MTAFDAIVFHERNLNAHDLPNLRTNDQIYIHYNLEAPVWSSIHGVTTYDHYFNISMSYRSDAQILLPYGSVEHLDENLIIHDSDLKHLIEDFGAKNTHLANKTQELKL